MVILGASFPASISSKVIHLTLPSTEPCQFSGKGTGFEKEYKILRLLNGIVPLNISAVLQVGNGQARFLLNLPDHRSHNRFPRLNVSPRKSQPRPRIRRLGQSLLHQHPPLRIRYHAHITKFSFHNILSHHNHFREKIFFKHPTEIII